MADDAEFVVCDQTIFINLHCLCCVALRTPLAKSAAL